MFNAVLSIPLPGPSQPSDALPNGVSRGKPLGQFIAGRENHLAAAALLSLANDESSGEGAADAHPYSPLIFFGPPGTGKSHLAGAAAEAVRRRDADAQIAYVCAADYARELAESIEKQATGPWERRYREADLLIIEDLDHLAPKPAAQEHLSATLDVIARRGRRVIVTSRTSPAEIAHLSPALRSRLIGGLAVPLQAPGLEARREILRLLAAERRVRLSPEGLERLASTITGGVRELFGALVHLEAAEGVEAAGDRRREIGPELVDAFLNGRGKARTPTIAAIAARTAKFYSLRLAELRGPGRRQNLALARNAAMYLARRMTGASYGKIGDYFGGRDHTTALYACRKVARLAADDAGTRRELLELERSLAL